MKVIFLNIWGGRVFEPLMEFIQGHAQSTDFFCFQEMLHSQTAALTTWGGRGEIWRELNKALPQFEGYYKPSHNILDQNGKPDPNISVGVAIFAKKEIEIKGEGRIHIQGDSSGISHDDKLGAPHYFQYVRFEHNGKPYTLCNMHGTAHPGDKLDTPERLKQSKRIVDFFAKEEGKILGGDFNLLPNTESISLIEKSGMRNLIKEFGIQTTRSKLNDERYPEPTRQYFSDYVFVSQGIQVTNFEVPQVNISDHLPLILEFS